LAFGIPRSGLMSYGIDQIDQWRGAATYVDRILRGEKPGDLPVQAPTKFELVTSRKNASGTGFCGLARPSSRRPRGQGTH
jgi:putative ABC transport system substrate-binding protein